MVTLSRKSLTQRLILSALLAAMISGPGLALELEFPAPVVGVEVESQSPAAVELPIGVFANGSLPVERVTGALDRRAWQLDSPRLSLTELSEPLRAQLLNQGYELIFDCESRGCGGFDFRFAIHVMAEPGMHVDLGDFRFIAARKGAEVVNLLISRSQGYGFVQLTRVADQPLPELEVPGAAETPAKPVTAEPGGGDTGTAEASPVEPSNPEPPVTDASQPGAVAQPVVPTAAPGTDDIPGMLEAGTPIVLQDLVFASGSSALQEGSYGSLAALAAWLAADAKNAVILVGHTDDSGGLEANVALSKKRAQAVRQVLIKDHGVQSAQVSAEGVGPLAPLTSNLSEEGRQTNRRVEAVPVRRP